MTWKTCSRIGIAVLLILLSQSPAPAAAADIQCAECGMMVMMDSHFTGKTIQGESTLYFCDIGDLFSYLKRKDPKDAKIEVKDYQSGAWIDARTAYFVRSEKKFKTPMGWGIAAFAHKNEASTSGNALDFESMLKALK